MKTSFRSLFSLALMLPTLLSSLHAATTLRISNSQITPESKYQLIFDRAVIPEDQVNQVEHNKIIQITPALPGKIHWKSSNVADFIPTTPPNLGTTYTFTLKAGLTDRDGKAVPSIKLKTISSEPFRISRTTRKSKSNQYTRQQVYYLAFNDTVDINEISRYFIFKNAEGQKVSANVRHAKWSDVKSTYSRGYTWQERFDVSHLGKKATFSTDNDAIIQHAIIVTSANPLPIGDKWYLYALKNIPNKSKTAIDKVGRNIPLGNIDPFVVENVSPKIFVNKPRKLVVAFNSYLPTNLTQNQLKRLITITPELKDAQYKVLGKTITITGDLRSADEWNVSVQPSISSANGLALTKAFKKEVTFYAIASGIALPAFDSAQYANGKREYAIDTINIDSIRMRVKQLTPEDAIRTMQGYRHYTGNGHNNQKLNPKVPLPYTLVNGKTVYDRTIVLDNKIDTSKMLNLNWNEILPKGQHTTTFFVSIEGSDKEKSRGDDRIAQSFVQLTDIGLCWKLSEKEAMVYAFSCQTGKPMAHVELQAFNEDATPSNRSITDTNGIAKIPRSELARHLRATKGQDCYIIPFDNTLSTIPLWRFPVDMEWNHIKGWKRTAKMFTDRNLYRPGETVQLKGVVRRFLDNNIKLTSEKKAQLIISDSASRVLVDKEITLSNNGTFDHTLNLPAETVGRFRAKLIFPEDPEQSDTPAWLTDRHRIFYHSFNVQEFRRNAYEAKSNIPDVAPGSKDIVLDIDAQYYQGQPVKDGRVEWYFEATESGFYPSDFRDYLFGDHRHHDAGYWNYYFGYGGTGSRKSDRSNDKTHLDENGKISISHELPEPKFPSPIHVNVHTEITDSRDQTLTTIATNTIHPADTYIGITRNDRLIRVGQDPELELIAVDTSGQRIKEPVTVKAVIIREHHETIKVKSEDGKISVRNNKKITTIKEQEITIQPNQANTLPFTPEESGHHVITLSGVDKNGHKFTTATSIQVYGTNTYPWATQDGMNIKLIPEKKLYQPGDTARILVMTPIEGTALVTVERAGVHQEYRRELKADNPVIEVPLTDKDAPNTYLSVVVIRGAEDSPRKHKEPLLKLGYCTINVQNVKDRLAVELELPDSQHRPGEVTKVSGTVKLHDGSPAAGAEVVFYAEDEGALAVAGYKTPNLMDYFHSPRPLLVQSGTSFSTFISENSSNYSFGNKGFTIGGGDGEMEEAGVGGSNVKLRSNFDPCAIWKPSVITNSEGKFQVTINNPDTLTRYRVIAIAIHGAKKFGHKTTEYTVNQPIMLEPAAPRYASEGDRLSPKVLVQNNSPYEGVWKISLLTDDITIPTTSDQGDNEENTLSTTVTLKPGDATTVYFDVQFANTGTTRWIWSATPVKIKGSEELTPVLSRDLSDRAQTEFEVTYPAPTMRQVEFISMSNDSQHDLLKDIDSELLGGRGYVDLELSNSLLLQASNASDFLLRYPYGCLEQTSSSLMPWFAMRDLKSILPNSNKTEAQINKAIQAGADRLLSMQTSDGGLGYWPGSKRSMPWATSYGGMALILAERNGASVPKSSIEQLTNWMSNSVKQDNADQTSYWAMESRARTLYVLAIAGKAEIALQNKMIDHRATLSPTALCFLALAVHNSGEVAANKATALSLLEDIKPREMRKHWMRYHSDEAMQVLVWSEIAPENPQVHQLMQAMLGKRNPYGHWSTTWTNSWALQAMASYGRNVEKNRKPATIQIVTNEGIKTINLNQKTPTTTVKIPLQADLKITASSDETVHTNVKVNSKPALALTGPRGYSGMSIIRRYERISPDGNTQPLGQPQVGDLVKVNLDITFSSALDFVVIEDRLPSLFEAVNNDFKSQKSKFRGNSDHDYSINHKELRSDRACFFVNRTWRNGTRTVSYIARVTSAGTATAPAAKVECMYDPIQIAITKSEKLTTLKKKTVATK